jgi:hypothetical protein
VPQKQAEPPPGAAPHVSLASARAAAPKLSIGASHAQHTSAPKPVAPQVAALEAKLAQARAGDRGAATKWVGIGAAVVILGVGAYFGYGYYTQWRAKKEEAAKAAAAPPPVTNDAPAEPAAPAPPKELPVLPAVWTLDVDQAKIPEGKANGSISGSNFMVEAAFCTRQYLELYEGNLRAPERAVLIFLNLKPNEGLTNRSFTVAPEKRDPGIKQVAKLWKTDPRFQAHNQPYGSGYALKLELGDMTGTNISGKIFLALPDTEQSVVAGEFKAAAFLPTVTASAPTMQQAPVPTAADPAARSAFESRYGKRR